MVLIRLFILRPGLSAVSPKKKPILLFLPKGTSTRCPQASAGVLLGTEYTNVFLRGPATAISAKFIS